MPRRYRMNARTAAVEETRRRIVEAGKALHAQQGILGTSYEEIARQASTAPATVYRHFPSLNELLPACASSIRVLKPLTPEQAAEIFHGIGRPTARLELLVRGTCDCYARDRGWLRAARGEEANLPALRDIVRVQRDNLHLLTRACLAGANVSERTARMIAALIDFPVWQALREAGFDATEASGQLLELVRDQLAKEEML